MHPCLHLHRHCSVHPFSASLLKSLISLDTPHRLYFSPLLNLFPHSALLFSGLTCAHHPALSPIPSTWLTSTHLCDVGTDATSFRKLLSHSLWVLDPFYLGRCSLVCFSQATVNSLRIVTFLFATKSQRPSTNVWSICCLTCNYWVGVEQSCDGCYIFVSLGCK